MPQEAIIKYHTLTLYLQLLTRSTEKTSKPWSHRKKIRLISRDEAWFKSWFAPPPLAARSSHSLTVRSGRLQTLLGNYSYPAPSCMGPGLPTRVSEIKKESFHLSAWTHRMGPAWVWEPGPRSWAEFISFLLQAISMLPLLRTWIFTLPLMGMLFPPPMGGKMPETCLMDFLSFFFFDAWTYCSDFLLPKRTRW